MDLMMVKSIHKRIDKGIIYCKIFLTDYYNHLDYRLGSFKDLWQLDGEYLVNLLTEI